MVDFSTTVGFLATIFWPQNYWHERLSTIFENCSTQFCKTGQTSFIKQLYQLSDQIELYLFCKLVQNGLIRKAVNYIWKLVKPVLQNWSYQFHKTAQLDCSCSMDKIGLISTLNFELKQQNTTKLNSISTYD